MNSKLPDDIHENIQRLCAEGDSLVEAAHYSDALARFKQALALLPVPHLEWEAATWIYAALGETYFLAGDFECARQALTTIMLCPAALDNPFVWLRRGQVYFELGDMQQAQDSLASAFMLAGREVFEHEDPKYAAFILPKLNQQNQL
jgi:tetratricopeptide (TPR) repeat protein